MEAWIKEIRGVSTPLEMVEDLPSYWALRFALLDDMLTGTEEQERPATEKSSLQLGKTSLPQKFHALARQFLNDVQYHQKTTANRDFPPIPHPKEPIVSVKEHILQWKDHLRSRWKVISESKGLPMSRPRSGVKKTKASPSVVPKDQDAPIAVVVPASPLPRPGATRPTPGLAMFEVEDLLHMLEKIASPNYAGTLHHVKEWGCIRVQLNVSNKEELRSVFQALHPSVRQVGLDDRLADWFAQLKVNKGRLVEQQGLVQEAQAYAWAGVPNECRCGVWCAAMGRPIVPSDRERMEWKELDLSLEKRWLLVDDLVREDVTATVCQNDQFFLFDDVIEQMCLLLVRDGAVWRESSVHCPAVHVGVGVGVDAAGRTLGVYPPSGVVPFRGWSMLAAPLSYITDDPVMMYVMFRTLWTRFFCKLSTISSQRGSIAWLSRQFEHLAQQAVPRAYYHVVQLGSQPLYAVFPWLMSAFVGFLPVQQVLLLWDRMVASSSTQCIAVLAAAVFAFRSSSLLDCVSSSEVEDVLGDLRAIQVVPLLQHFVFDV